MAEPLTWGKDALPTGPQGPTERRGLGWRQALAVVLVLCALLVAVWFLRVGSLEKQAIDKMDPQRRAVLFEESLATFRSMCVADRSRSFERRCRAQAQFLRQFPECGDECLAQLEVARPQPTR
ncbi:hypothetical protein P2318_00850 [Myxococcaceae bacterium GXIMD 01537]